ncbi:hypothetical protein QAD02_005130 [Eretmocerus hayati]|uniref:Uncharacterized protein n=1 Tax=Eretmocerus hayati TaxID=131215 RepID=A0ACC2NRN0_9HYME|nr:hypothetical protein QAD02_005130 [Eretmocerus hayati]
MLDGDEVSLKAIEVKWVIKDFATKSTSDSAHEFKYVSPPISLNKSKRCRLIVKHPARAEQGNKSCKEFLSVSFAAYHCCFEGTVTFYILDCSNGKHYKSKFEHYVFPEDGAGYRFPKFIPLSAFDSNPFLLPGGNLIIGCTIQVDFEISCNPTNDIVVDALGSSFFEDKLGKYQELFESEKYSDVKFVVQGKDIHAHKNVIASQSPVFAAMFEHEMNECNQNVVDIIDIPYRAMYELFRFIYAGTVKDIDDVAMDLLIASEKYLIKDLKTVCEKHLARKLSPKNIVSYLNLAELHGASQLKNRGIAFVTKYADIIADSPHFDVCKLHTNVMREVFNCMAKSKKRKLDE